MPATICQDFDALVKVTEYDFDLTNAEFRAYCEARGVMNRIARFAMTASHETTKEQFFNQTRLANPMPDGSRHQFSNKEIETLWRIFLAGKGAVQDCWEIFIGRNGRYHKGFTQ